jgi:hypothetical protein
MVITGPGRTSTTFLHPEIRKSFPGSCVGDLFIHLDVLLLGAQGGEEGRTTGSPKREVFLFFLDDTGRLDGARPAYDYRRSGVLSFWPPLSFFFAL